jgi:hypothetical protein|tara:strand:- start:381 stop:551 length:171 start_codon:yes stop_codon:yes gene_type:complete
MPHIARTQSITNRPSGGGVKKAGSAITMDFPRIPRDLLKRKTPKPYLFSATSGNSN